MLNSILLAILVALSIFCLIQLFKIERNGVIDSTELEYQFDRSLQSVLRKQNEEITKKYAEELSIASRIEMHFKTGEFDFVDFADEVKKRAVVLAIEKAESAVVLAEHDLGDVRHIISTVQKNLDEALERDQSVSIEKNKKTLKELNRQEGILKKRLDEAYDYLNSLTDVVTKTHHDQPMS